MKVRLHGTGEEVAEVTCRRLEILDVVSVSDPLPGPGASVLVRARCTWRSA